MLSPRFTCPCCGHQTLTGPPGSEEAHKVCFWEDDGVRLLDPEYLGGTNGPSLMERQAIYPARRANMSSPGTTGSEGPRNKSTHGTARHVACISTGEFSRESVANDESSSLRNDGGIP